MEDHKLDENWIQEFEEVDNCYSMFYKENNEIIKVKYIYVDKTRNVQRVKREKVILSIPNVIASSVLLNLVRLNQTPQYRVEFALKYNVHIEPSEVKHLFNNKIDETKFITEITDFTKDVHFQKTIPMFQELNEISIYFIQKTSTHAKTRRNVGTKPITHTHTTRRKY